jgi:hypothetical protein
VAPYLDNVEPTGKFGVFFMKALSDKKHFLSTFGRRFAALG